MARASSQPISHMEGRVVVDGVPLALKTGSYKVSEAQRFGEKISTGDLTYADFNPYESAHGVKSLIGGYGLRAYVDLEDAEQAATFYDETDNVDTAQGVAILSPYRYNDPLPGATETPVWIGDFRPAAGSLAGQTVLVAVAGTGIWYWQSGAWVSAGVTLPASARKGAVGVFNGRLVIGFGAAALAVWTEDLSAMNQVLTEISPTSTTRRPLYVFAFTADRAAAYLAGGPVSSDTYTITSSAHGGINYDPSLVVCGSSDSDITALAPGGGIVTVYVGKETELGSIDNNGVYRNLIPFDSRLTTNCQGLGWWLSNGGEAQRGPVILRFRRDNSAWIYQPSAGDAGRAQNISVHAVPGLRPRTVKGPPMAFQGSARWLYYIVTTRDGNSYIVRRDALSGATHTWVSLGVVAAHSLVVTGVIGENPHLIVGSGTSTTRIVLPLDGEDPRDDEDCKFTREGTLRLPAIELNFPDEDKIPFSIRVITNNCIPGERYIEVYSAEDGGDFALLQTVATDAESVHYIDHVPAKKITLKFRLVTEDPDESPELVGLSFRTSLNPELYRLWTFQAWNPGVSHTIGDPDLTNAKDIIAAFWSAREAGTPVEFTDRWDDQYRVRIMRFEEIDALQEPNSTPESLIGFILLEVERIGRPALYNDAPAEYDALGTLYGGW